LICGHHLIPNSTRHFLYCGRAILYIRPVSSIPIGRNTGQWGPATVQAMGYPTHENALRSSLTLNTFYGSIVTDQVFDWQDIISFPVCRFCPPVPTS